jgi:hypothetical protein
MAKINGGLSELTTPSIMVIKCNSSQICTSVSHVLDRGSFVVTLIWSFPLITRTMATSFGVWWAGSRFVNDVELKDSLSDRRYICSNKRDSPTLECIDCVMCTSCWEAVGTHGGPDQRHIHKFTSITLLNCLTQVGSNGKVLSIHATLVELQQSSSGNINFNLTQGSSQHAFTP